MLTIEKLMEEWAIDSKIDNKNLDTSALRTANLHQKYLDELTLYKIRIFKLDREYLQMKGVRSRYFMGQMTKPELDLNGWTQYQHKTPLKSELDRLLETDPTLLSLKDKTEYYTICFEYAQEVIKAIRDRNFLIKSAIEWIKFQAGN